MAKANKKTKGSTVGATIKVKPLSTNNAFQGRRYKTPLYKSFEEECLWLLPNLQIPEGLLEVHYTFGLSNKLADIDNPTKLFQDILQKRYSFNDAKIYRLIIDKVIVKKGEEFITFSIFPYEN